MLAGESGTLRRLSVGDGPCPGSRRVRSILWAHPLRSFWRGSLDPPPIQGIALALPEPRPPLAVA